MLLRFSLIDYTFNPSGDTTFIDEPNGWQNIAIKVKRDKKTHGIFFDVTANSLEFVGDGYSVIKSAYDDSGVFANTKILVEINCSENYRTLYEGRLRYEAVEFLYSDYCMAKVPIEQVGCLQTFINRQETEVDINAETTLEGTVVTNYPALSDEINLVSKEIVLISQGSYDFTRFHEDLFMSVNIPQGVVGTFFLTPTKDDLEIFSPIDGYWFDFESDAGTLANEGRLNLEPIYEVAFTDIDCVIGNNLDVEIVFNAEWVLTQLSGTGNTAYTCLIALVHETTSGVVTRYDLDSQTGNLSTLPDTLAIAINSTQSIPVSNGDKFWFEGVFAVTGGLGTSGNLDVIINPTGTCTFKVSLGSQCDETPCKIAFINEVLSRNAELITDGCLRVYSEYFGRTDSQPYAHASDGCGSLEVIANGLQIRRATRTDGSNPKLFVNFKDLYDGLNAIHNIGMGIEEDTQGRDYMLRIEPVAYWFPYTVLHTVDLPMEVKISYDESRSFQTVQIGYDKWESEYSGGLDEFLTKREYRTELTTVDNKLEQLSKLIASGYAIEVTRRQGQTTEDFTYDNDIFIICLERGGYTGFEVEIVPLTAVNVLSTTNIYNVRISPVRNLIRWFKTIASGWTKLFATDNKLLIFNSGEGNYIADLTNTAPDSCWVGDSIEENQDVSKNTETGTTPLWEAETIEFEYPLSWDDFLTIKADPKGLVQVNLTNSTIYGWIEEINYKPNEGMAVWKLLKAYDAEANI